MTGKMTGKMTVLLTSFKIVVITDLLVEETPNVHLYYNFILSSFITCPT